MSYKVEVTREGDTWIADVVDVPGAHTDARNLATLNERIQEVIGLVLDRPEDEVFEVELQFVGVDDAFAAAVELGQERARLDERQYALSAKAMMLARNLADAGWSVRDIGPAMKMTPGRVSQILKATKLERAAA